MQQLAIMLGGLDFIKKKNGRQSAGDTDNKPATQYQTMQLDTEDEGSDASGSTGKRAVYEPKDYQHCQRLVCSHTRAIVIVVLLCLLALIIALIAAFAHPGSQQCSLDGTTSEKTETVQDFIATNGEKFPWTDIRLPDNVAPVVYRLFMHPNLTTFHFSGTVEIDLQVNKPADFLVIHSKDINISSCDLVQLGSGHKVDIVKVLHYKAFEQMYLKLGSTLKARQQYTLKIKFERMLSDLLAGFYKSSYGTKSGETRWLATTHFEPTDARAAFPCFDEPHLKANFSMSMVRDVSHISLFNTERVKEEVVAEDTNHRVDHFAVSVRMSTYLVAFVVCDYAKTTTYAANGNTTVSVYVPEELHDQAVFARDSAARILDKYENFFGEKYPLQKQDLIAIPDFAAGAMENWGLITYRFTAILYDEQESSASNQQWVAVVVAHELAHQWFGNLVTMKWWDDLWLNEGFASFVEYIGASYVAPKWNMMDQFISETLVPALHQDSLSSSHPISVPVHDPAQINEIFDGISYEKGASIIRMLDDFLTRDVFQGGLKTYLTRHKYGNAETDDLWRALSEEANKRKVDINVKEVMDTWTKQMGYPVVIARRDGDVMSVTQERFLLNPRGNQSQEFQSPFGYKWQIPLTFMTEKDPKMSLKWMKKEKDSFHLKHSPNWFKMNVNQMGFYRVHYEGGDNWQQIIKQLKDDHTVFSSADRAGLLDDAFALARSGHLDATVALELSQYLKKETDYVPWTVGLTGLKYIGALLEDKPSFNDYSAFILDLLEVQLDKTTWTDDGEHLEKFLRGLVLGQAVSLNHRSSVQQGKDIFNGWMNNGQKMAANLKNVVYHTGIKYGGQDEWDFAWEQYTKTDVPSEKKKLLYALSRTTDGMRLDRYLHMTLDETKIRKGDTVTVVTYIASSPAGRVLAWRFVKQNWQTFFKRYGTGAFDMNRLVKQITGMFTTQYDYDEVSEFFSHHLHGSGNRAVAQTLENIQMNIDWLSRNEKPVVDWLQNWAKGKPNQ